MDGRKLWNIKHKIPKAIDEANAGQAYCMEDNVLELVGKHLWVEMIGAAKQTRRYSQQDK